VAHYRAEVLQSYQANFFILKFSCLDYRVGAIGAVEAVLAVGADADRTESLIRNMRLWRKVVYSQASLGLNSLAWRTAGLSGARKGDL
jgi:hypothetical protein